MTPEATVNTTVTDYFLRQSAQSASSPTASARSQAIAALRRYGHDMTDSFDSFTTSRLGNFAATLLLNGYTVKTTSYYLKHLSALYTAAVNDSLATPVDSFSVIRDRLAALDGDTSLHLCGIKVTEQLRHLFLRHIDDPERQLARDITLTSVIAGGLTFTDIASLTTERASTIHPSLEEIIARHRSPRSRYLFPLRHTARTPRQLHDTIRSMIAAILDTTRLTMAATPDDTAALLLFHAAVECGFAPSAAATALSHRPFSGIVTLLDADPATRPDTPRQILSTVADAITRNPLQWFAMQFRPGVKLDDITRRIHDTAGRIAMPEIYYPCHEIARRIGHRLTHENRPVIPGILFFRTRVTDVAPLFAHIGDLAWCYRQSPTPTSPYAAISQNDMKLFQAALGSFTSDIDIHPLGNLTPRPGEPVILIKAGYGNRRGVLEQIIDSDNNNSNGNSVIFRIKLSTDQGYEWRVDVDPRQIESVLND